MPRLNQKRFNGATPTFERLVYKRIAYFPVAKSYRRGIGIDPPIERSKHTRSSRVGTRERERERYVSAIKLPTLSSRVIESSGTCHEDVGVAASFSRAPQQHPRDFGRWACASSTSRFRFQGTYFREERAGMTMEMLV